MKRLTVILLAVFFIATYFSNPVLAGNAQEGNTSENKITWLNFEEGVKVAKKENKKIFIDVYTHWCGWCKKMDKATFGNADVITYVNENYVAVKFNAEQKEPINYQGKEYKFIPSGRRGYHELAASLLNGRLSYPTVAFLDEEANLLTSVPGYRGPQQMEPLLVYFGEGHYKETSDINQFISTYKPTFK